MSLKNRITEDMKDAMRARAVARLSTIRLLLAAIKQKEVDERVDVGDADIVAIIERMIKQRRESIAQFEAEATNVHWPMYEGKPRPWSARFVCVLALAKPGHPTQFFEGECRGEIVPEWRGEAGFGYDPVFLVPGTGRTFGEMPPEEKRLYSHRARATRALLESAVLERLYD
jgi:hypothetical protein